MNVTFALVGATLADTGYIDQADRILALVGHPANRGRAAEDVDMATDHAVSILGDFPGGMCRTCADALVDWSLTWSGLPEACAALRLV